MAHTDHTCALDTERDSQVMDGDLDHSVRVHMFHCNKKLIKNCPFNYFQFSDTFKFNRILSFLYQIWNDNNTQIQSTSNFSNSNTNNEIFYQAKNLSSSPLSLLKSRKERTAALEGKWSEHLSVNCNQFVMN